MSALDTQVGGEHYKTAKIQPVQYIEANGLLFLEGCVVKRVTRHDKPTGKGRQDIEKAIHELQLLLELRYGDPVPDIYDLMVAAEQQLRAARSPTEPAAEIDDDSPRQQAIAQNGNDGAVYEELSPLAMGDWQNWQPGDVIRFTGGGGDDDCFTTGNLYVVRAINPQSSNQVSVVADDSGDRNGWCARFFEWHSRPDK